MTLCYTMEIVPIGIVKFEITLLNFKYQGTRIRQLTAKKNIDMEAYVKFQDMKKNNKLNKRLISSTISCGSKWAPAWLS